MKTIGELLTGREVLTLRRDASVLEAARLMADHKVGAVLIADPGGGAEGIFTERDLMVRVVAPGRDLATTQVGSVMSTEIFQAGPDDRVTTLAQEMQKRHIRHLPVVEGDRVLGLLSQRDLLRAHLEITTGEVEALTAYIQGEDHEPDAAEG